MPDARKISIPVPSKAESLQLLCSLLLVLLLRRIVCAQNNGQKSRPSVEIDQAHRRPTRRHGFSRICRILWWPSPKAKSKTYSCFSEVPVHTYIDHAKLLGGDQVGWHAATHGQWVVFSCCVFAMRVLCAVHIRCVF